MTIALSFVSFALVRWMPGDPISEQAASNPNMKPEDVRRLRAEWGLDDPLPVAYGKWVHQIAWHGDLGWSKAKGAPVRELLADRIPKTLLLTGTAFLASLLAAVPLAGVCALWARRWPDLLLNAAAFLAISIPTFWLGTMLILVFGVRLQWLPVAGYDDESLGVLLRHLALPALTLVLVQTGQWLRYLRAGFLDEMRLDFVRTARAKGLSPARVVVRHVLPNVFVLLVTLVTLAIPGLFSGAIVTEIVFSWRGMGTLLYEAVTLKDAWLAPLVFTGIGALVFFSNLLADVLYGIVDPRVRRA